MSDDHIFKLAADSANARQKAERLFDEISIKLRGLLPASADIRHIGATAVSGCLTKGDLDIVVRVPADDFDQCDASLAALFERNVGSARTDTFSAFEDGTTTPHLGIQLTVIGDPKDVFHLFAEALSSSAQLLDAYNQLKLRFHARPMDEYRRAKDQFVESVLSGARLARKH